MIKKTAILEIGEDLCCSCFLCADVCSRKALEFRLDDNGFYKPYVNYEQCNNCGLCYSVCPVCAQPYSRRIKNTPDIYAGWNKDNAVRIKSSSGGLFFELAKVFIEDGGIVFAVKWVDGLPKYDMAETVQELDGFVGAKYLQADASGVYSKVKKTIATGKKVLFVGLPCQVQAVSNYVKSDRLYTIDLVCAGVPSLKMFRKYCEEYFPGTNVTKVDFRVKNLDDINKPLSSWKDYSLEFYSDEKMLLSQKHNHNPFFITFNSAKCYNTACYKCPFNTMPRRGNITICDYWGARGEMDSEKGTSLLVVNDERGENFIDIYVRNNKNLYLRPVLDATPYKGTPRLDMKERVMSADRKDIFKSLEKDGFKVMYGKYFVPSFFKKVLNIVKAVLNK